jgi:ApaG protein
MMPPLFYKLSKGVRITVKPWYLASQSRPEANHYVFGYHVRIENVSEASIQLLTRRWLIKDAIGEETEVEGEGVVGEQPVIAPFRAHEYQSYCILKAPTGSMEGMYRFIRTDGSRFEAEIPRFTLDARATTIDG